MPPRDARRPPSPTGTSRPSSPSGPTHHPRRTIPSSASRASPASDVRRQRLLLYLLSGLCCGIAAFLLIVLAGSGQNTNGNLYELDAIAAAIIGGTLLSGGRGTIVGSVLGVLVFTTITNIFALNNLQSDVQQIAKGAIIVAAVLVQRRTVRDSEA
ncbi:ABC transporter permease [Streptomyces tanashiensis]